MSACSHTAMLQRKRACVLLLLSVQILAQRRFDDALVRHPAVPFVFNPGDVATQPAVLLSRQPKGQRVRVVFQADRSSRCRRGGCWSGFAIRRHRGGRLDALGHRQIVQTCLRT